MPTVCHGARPLTGRKPQKLHFEPIFTENLLFFAKNLAFKMTIAIMEHFMSQNKAKKLVSEEILPQSVLDENAKILDWYRQYSRSRWYIQGNC